MRDEDMRSPWSRIGRYAAVMGLLLEERFDLWAVAEVEREIGNAVAVRDSLRSLHGAGLIHEIDMGGFVMPSRAARGWRDTAVTSRSASATTLSASTSWLASPRTS